MTMKTVRVEGDVFNNNTLMIVEVSAEGKTVDVTPAVPSPPYELLDYCLKDLVGGKKLDYWFYQQYLDKPKNIYTLFPGIKFKATLVMEKLYITSIIRAHGEELSLKHFIPAPPARLLKKCFEDILHDKNWHIWLLGEYEKMQ